MPGLSEILRALYGVSRLARFDAGGLAFFDASITGFWRSFFAAVIVAPLYLAMLDARFATGTITVPAARFLAIELIAYVIGWVAYPLAMTAVVRAIGREPYYLRYIVAYNWVGVWQGLLYLPPSILTLDGVLTGGPAGLLTFAAFVAILVYGWFVARIGLAVPGPVAAAVVALETGLALVINTITDALL